MATIIIDNYDSFTYNLVQIVREVQQVDPIVKLNDQITIEEVVPYDHIILSPGPGIPSEAGLLLEVIRQLGVTHKIFGVCLGLQAIGEVYGARLKNLNRVYHGIQSPFKLTKVPSPIFDGVSQEFLAGRYHSWVIDRDTAPECLQITAIDEYGEIMAAQHAANQVYGVQFHPESIMTPEGALMVTNFLAL